MRKILPVLVVLVLMLAACETPIDASNRSDNKTIEPPHVEEVKKEEPPAPSPPPPAPAPLVPAQQVVAAPEQPEASPVEEPKPDVLVEEDAEPAPPPPAKGASGPETPGPQSPPSLPVLQDPAYTAPLPPDVVKLLVRADEKVKSYDFLYAPPPDNIPRDHYYIRGTRIKVELFEQGWFNPNTHMTAVYMDSASKVAAGFCEDNRITHCPDPQRRFPVEYSEHLIKTPYQWLKEISVGKATEGEKISDRFTKKIAYTKNNALFEQWLDSFSGLPLRVRVTNATGSFTFNFVHLNINSVNDDVFVHQVP